ncbi:hypothetical protein C8250_021520 [Streptomyces sp. So13.3]|uniref:hypothetical protein n=1 Tax=unclassified Streptomyces TaxID=2593676 RepID=UPI0011074179|nr:MULTISPECIES: hypothetical protein [unclassified Streptomyces]MCZ4099898.1 hypothetical protein [Streptomyces sp. H39-C1]QNA74142.1 hypothetical protein C8250_021520 [Streptomyces sp. So13.3]
MTLSSADDAAAWAEAAADAAALLAAEAADDAPDLTAEAAEDAGALAGLSDEQPVSPAQPSMTASAAAAHQLI